MRLFVEGKKKGWKIKYMLKFFVFEVKKNPKTGNNYFAEHPICQNNENTERFVD